MRELLEEFPHLRFFGANSSRSSHISGDELLEEFPHPERTRLFNVELLEEFAHPLRFRLGFLVFASTFPGSDHRTTTSRSSRAEPSRAEPEPSQPQGQRSSAEPSVKLPQPQSAPAPSFARSAATGYEPAGALIRAWAGVASLKRVQ